MRSRSHIALIPFLLLGSGCTGCSSVSYLAQQLPGQIDLLRHKIPVEDVIADPQTSPDLKRTLELSQLAKKYAVDHIGLKNNRNYTEYRDLKRDFAILSFVATPKTKLEAYEWSYPLFGSFPYLGFFKMEDAQEFERDFIQKGFDTRIRKAPAYSTLGWFRDAILNTMTDSPAALAETIIHEQTHATVYHNNQGTFNENLALYVGIHGTIEFLRTLDKSQWPDTEKWIASFDDRMKRQKVVNEWVKTATEKLNAIYKDPKLSDSEKIERRAPVFESLQNEWKKKINPAGIQDLNNAFVVSLGTYTANYDDLKAEHQKQGSLKALIEWAKKNPPK